MPYYWVGSPLLLFAQTIFDTGNPVMKASGAGRCTIPTRQAFSNYLTFAGTVDGH